MKLLIVEDSISSQFQMVTHLQAQLELHSDAIRIAENGSQALAIIEQHDIDVILMDIYMPGVDGIVATEKILNKYPEKKIIILTASYEERLIQKAIRAGAKGYLLKENIAKNLVPAIQNIRCGYTVFPLIENHNDIPPLTRSDKISKINQIITSRLIDVWTNGSQEVEIDSENFQRVFGLCSDDEQNLINLMLRDDLTDFNLVKELNLRFDQIISELIDFENIEDDQFEQVFEKLDFLFFTEEQSSSFSSFKSRMEANAQVLRIKYYKDLQEFLNSIALTTAPISFLTYLEATEQLLKDQTKNYQQELEQYQKQEKSAFNAYQKLLTDLYFIYQPKQPKSKHDQIKAITRAILVIYSSKMQSQSISLVIQMIEGLIKSLQLYIDKIILTIDLLNQVQNELEVSDDDNFAYSIEKEFKAINNATKIRQEIERKFGYPLNQWGIEGSINLSRILSEITAKISPHSDDILSKVEQN